MDWCGVVGPRGLCRPLDEKKGFPTNTSPLTPCQGCLLAGALKGWGGWVKRVLHASEMGRTPRLDPTPMKNVLFHEKTLSPPNKASFSGHRQVPFLVMDRSALTRKRRPAGQGRAGQGRQGRQGRPVFGKLPSDPEPRPKTPPLPDGNYLYRRLVGGLGRFLERPCKWSAALSAV